MSANWTPEFCEAIRNGILEQLRALGTSIDRRMADHLAAMDRRFAEYRDAVRSDIGELKDITIANRVLLTGNGNPDHGLVWKVDATRAEVKQIKTTLHRREQARARVRRVVLKILASRAAWKIVAAFAAGGTLAAAAAAVWESL